MINQTIEALLMPLADQMGLKNELLMFWANTKSYYMQPLIKLFKGRKRSALFISIFSYLLFRYYRSKRLSIKYIKTARNKILMNLLENHIKSYSPTFYLPHPFLSMYLISGDYEYFHCYIRHNLQLSDGEELALDIFPRDLNKVPAEMPTLIFQTGINGDSRCHYSVEFCEMVYKDLGWRVVVQNKRGFGHKMFKAPTFISWTKHDDIDEVIDFVQEKWPDSPVYLSGVSLGANYACKYVCEKNKNKQMQKIKGLILISNPWDIRLSSIACNKSIFIRASMLDTFKSLINDHLHEELVTETLKEMNVDINAVMTCKTIGEFDQHFTCKLMKVTAPEYYHMISSTHVAEYLNVPTLVINSLNDPIIPEHCIPYEKLNANPNVFMVTTGGGGHVEYFTGLRKKMWAFELAIKYMSHLNFKKLYDMKDNTISSDNSQ